MVFQRKKPRRLTAMKQPIDGAFWCWFLLSVDFTDYRLCFVRFNHLLSVQVGSITFICAGYNYDGRLSIPTYRVPGAHFLGEIIGLEYDRIVGLITDGRNRTLIGSGNNSPSRGLKRAEKNIGG